MELTVQGMVARRAEASGRSGKPMPRRPLDLVQLARYTLGNRSHEQEVLELFRTQSGRYLKRLEAAGNDPAWRDAAGTIKGSAHCIGAWRVADIAAEAETLDGTALTASRDRLLEALRQEIDAANDFIRALLDGA